MIRSLSKMRLPRDTGAAGVLPRSALTESGTGVAGGCWRTPARGASRRDFGGAQRCGELRAPATRSRQRGLPSLALRASDCSRAGISLLEVLFSIFILSIGLLGLAALIPAGTLDVAEATKADRGSSAGRAAYREARVRKFADPGQWMNHMVSDDPVNTGDVNVPQKWWDLDDLNEPNPLSPVDEGHSICIDPLFIARSHTSYLPVNSSGLPPIYSSSDPSWPNLPNVAWPGRTFPYYLDNDPSSSTVVTKPNLSGNILGPPRMSRVTLRSWPSKYAPMMSLGLADRIFRWQDDLLFDLPTDDTLRPNAIVDSLGRGQTDGNYTWMATLTPADGQDEAAVSQRRLYNYSVVVFYKRNLEMPVPINQVGTLAADQVSWNLSDRGLRPSERVVLADFLSPSVSFGGGDVRLRLVVSSGASNSDPADPERSDFTNIRAGNWILLSGYFPSTTEHHSAFQWFRVLSVDDGPTLVEGNLTASNQPEWIRDVTLAGPDWDASAFEDVDDPQTNTTIPAYRTCYATLVEGVVAVFSKTISLDTSAN